MNLRKISIEINIRNFKSLLLNERTNIELMYPPLIFKILSKNVKLIIVIN